MAFVFFFFIFFVNQILLLARKVLLSNVDFKSMIQIVILAIPQFLLYTFPFASLSGASMIIADLASGNEILALRSLGISMKKIYTSIIIIAILLSGVTFTVADILLPYSAIKYQQLYKTLLTKMPSIELDSNTSTTFGDIVISNGRVDGSNIEDIVIFDRKQSSSSQVITAHQGILKLIDLQNYIYSLELIDPTVITTDDDDGNNWSIADSSKVIFYIDFSSQVPSLTSTAPSNLSTVDLMTKIKANKSKLKLSVEDWVKDRDEKELKMAKANDTIISNSSVDIMNIDNSYYDLQNETDRPIDFYLQYYRAELNKKFALSAACFFLVFMTFPLSYIKFKHGKLIGFAISMLVAVFYWYMLFFAQLKIFSSALNPAFLMWAPNIIIFVLSLLMIKVFRN
ncbi:MAG: LptF/LptG family permease [Sphaerochaetaceae bacterium]|nr:LptF/LptG family permease [Sphaerochaetaceae bacterium]